MKIIWRILLGLIVIFLLIALLAPKHHFITRETVINAPKELIYDQINDLKKWDTWSPWEQSDATIKKTYGPETEGKGSYYKWDSKHSGQGKVTITSASADSINTEVEFVGMGTSKSTYALSTEDKNTKVSWNFSFDTPFPWNAVNWIMMGDKSVGKEFEKGLASLKKVCEDLNQVVANKYKGYYVKSRNVPTALYAFKRSLVPINKLSAYFGSSYTELNKYLTEQGVKVTGFPSGLYWTFDLNAGNTDVGAAFPVDKTISGNAQMSTIELGGKAVIVDFFGNYNKLGEAHKAIGDYLAEKSMKMKAPVLEQYITDPMSEKDTTKWQTKIIYFVQ